MRVEAETAFRNGFSYCVTAWATSFAPRVGIEPTTLVGHRNQNPAGIASIPPGNESVCLLVFLLESVTTVYESLDWESNPDFRFTRAV